MKALRIRLGWVLAGLLLAGGAEAADVTVSAASSLTNAFQEIARLFERDHPGTRVLLNFGASGQLAQQIIRGAPVDVFAAADEESMDRVAREGALDRASRRDFARNTMVLVVPADSTATLAAITDLRQPAVQRIAMGNPDSVPAGRYARLALEKAALWPALKERVVQTVNVRQALDYVGRGEADAAFVYATDVAAAFGRVRVAAAVDVPVPIRYPAALVRGGGNRKAGTAFLDYLASPPARAVLGRLGFLNP